VNRERSRRRGEGKKVKHPYDPLCSQQGEAKESLKIKEREEEGKVLQLN